MPYHGVGGDLFCQLAQVHRRAVDEHTKADAMAVACDNLAVIGAIFPNDLAHMTYRLIAAADHRHLAKIPGVPRLKQGERRRLIGPGARNIFGKMASSPRWPNPLRHPEQRAV